MDKMIVETNNGLYSFSGDNGAVSVPITVIVAGVFNKNLRDAETVRKSLPLWEGVNIIRYVDEKGRGVHPPDLICTSVKQVVGKLRDVYWDDIKKGIVGRAEVSEELGAKSSFIEQLANGTKYGISSMYFCDVVNDSGEVEGIKYVTRSYNLMPNNIAIVDNPACPLNKCGINVEEKIIEKIGGLNNMTEEITKEYVDGLKATIESKAETIIALEGKNTAIIEELVATKADLVKVTAERDAIIEELKNLKNEAKKIAFLAKFPEQNRKMAAEELLPVFMESPEKLIIEHAERFNELLTVAVPVIESKSQEFVPVPTAEEEEFANIGLPTKEELMADFGIKI